LPPTLPPFPYTTLFRSARRTSRVADPAIFDFVHGVLTLDAAPPSGQRRQEMLRFAMRYQQFTAPVVAKGVEDTAFYRYNRLIARSEEHTSELQSRENLV